jgi:hypothetical protein
MWKIPALWLRNSEMFGVDSCAQIVLRGTIARSVSGWNIPETENSHIGNLRPLSDVAGARLSASKLSGAKKPV